MHFLHCREKWLCFLWAQGGFLAAFKSQHILLVLENYAFARMIVTETELWVMPTIAQIEKTFQYLFYKMVK
jgi:hypothetical protein